MIEAQGSGVVVALHAAAAGSLSRSSTFAPASRSKAGDAVRGYGTGAQILAALGVHDMILLTEHPSLAGWRLPATAWRSSKSGRSRRATEPMSTILLAEARFYPHLNDMLLAGARARDRGRRATSTRR